MLEHLEIHNYVLIEDVKIDFTPGFTVLTGETGAGKSIILGAIGLISGEKAESSIIRTGEKEAVISAVFRVSPYDTAVYEWLQERDFEIDDGELLVRRIIKDNGRSLIYLQGQSITRQELASLGKLLFDISSQHGHQSLLSADKQRQVLDNFGKLQEDVKSYGVSYKFHEQLLSDYEELENALSADNREIDYLRFALEEIEKAHLQKGEDEYLAQELSRSSHAEALHSHIELTLDLLKGDASGSGVLPALHDASVSLQKASHFDAPLADLAARIESLRLDAEDIRETLKDKLDTLFFSAEELDSLQARQAEIQRLKKKYGPSLDAVIAYGEKIKVKLQSTVNGEDQLIEMKQKLKIEEEKLQVLADNLTQKRRVAAQKLSQEIVTCLRPLGMKDAELNITVALSSRKLSGQDEIEFEISANKGEALRPLRSIVSGGELSRVMLALKTVLAQSDSVDTLIFDEIDAGIGGTVAHAVGERLSALSKHRQVLVITHLATIAARAGQHLVVAKQRVGERTRTEIQHCSGNARIQEIARMLSGENTDISRQHAKELLDEHLD